MNSSFQAEINTTSIAQYMQSLYSQSSSSSPQVPLQSTSEQPGNEQGSLQQQPLQPQLQSQPSQQMLQQPSQMQTGRLLMPAKEEYPSAVSNLAPLRPATCQQLYQSQPTLAAAQAAVYAQALMNNRPTYPETFAIRPAPMHSIQDPKHEVKRRRRLTSDETRQLNYVFQNRTTKPDAALRQQLADELGMTARAVQVWFQNRRAKVKREKNFLDKEGVGYLQKVEPVLDSVMLASMVQRQQQHGQEQRFAEEVKMESMLDFDTLIEDDDEDDEDEEDMQQSQTSPNDATLINSAAEAVAKSASLIEPQMDVTAGNDCMSVWEAAGFTAEELASLAQYGLDASFMTTRPTTLADDALSLLNQPVPLDAGLAAALAGLYSFDSSQQQQQQQQQQQLHSSGFNDDRFCFDSPLTSSSTSSPFKADFGYPLTPSPDAGFNSMDLMMLPMTDVHRPRRGSSLKETSSMRAIAPRVCSNLPTPKSSSPLSFNNVNNVNGPMRRPTLERDYLSHSITSSPYYRGSVSPPKHQQMQEQPQQLVWINTITPDELNTTNTSQLRRHCSWHGQR